MKKIILLLFGFFFMGYQISYTQTLLDEGFEGIWLPTGWTEYQLGDAAGFIQSTKFVNTGNYAAFHDDNNVATNCKDWLVSPALVIDNVGYNLTFWQYQNYSSYYVEHDVVIMNGADPTTATHLETILTGVGTEDTWTEHTFSLDAYNGQTIYIGFYYEGDNADEWAIDDILVYRQAYNFSIAAQNDALVEINTSYNYLVELANSGFNDDTYDLSITGDGSWTYTILDKTGVPATSLFVASNSLDTFYVQVSVPGTANLGNIDVENIAITSLGDATVTNNLTITTTALGPITPPYFQDFENSGTIPTVWTQHGQGEWEFTTSMGHGADNDHTSGSGYFAGLDDSSPNDDEDEFILYSPVFDLAGSGITPAVRFWYMNTDSPTKPITELYIEGWDGSAWVQIDYIDYAIVEWTELIYSLSAFSTQNNFQMRFRAITTSSYYSDPSLDDFVIFDAHYDDAQMLSVNSSLNGVFSGEETISVSLYNNGLNTINPSSLQLGYILDEGTAVLEPAINSIAPFTSSDFAFTTPPDISALGEHTLKVFVRLTGDEDGSNDTLTTTFTSCSAITSFPFTDDLENGNSYFYQTYNNYSNAYVRDDDGEHALYMEGGTSSSGWSGNGGSVTPDNAWNDNVSHQANSVCKVDAGSISTNLFLTFDLKQTNTLGYTDYSWLRVLLDDGVNPLVQLPDVYGNTNFLATTPIMEDYRTITIDLSGYVGTEFSLTFQSSCKYNDYGSSPYLKSDAAWIDNVYLGELPLHDVGAYFAGDTVFSVAGDTIYPEAIVHNYGTADQTTPFDVTLTIEPGGYSSTRTVTVDAFGDSTVVFDSMVPTEPGMLYTATITTALSGDEDTGNDSETMAIKISQWYAGGDDMTDGAYKSASAAYNNGTDKLLFSIGGNRTSSNNAVMVYDYNAGTWSSTTPLPSGSVGGCAAIYQDQIIVHAGRVDGTISNSMYLFDIATETWTSAAPSPLASTMSSITVLGDYAYLIGGYNGAGAIERLSRYDFTTDSWSNATALYEAVYYGGSLLTVGDKLVHIQGYTNYYKPGNIYIGEVNATNPDVITWTKGTPCPVGTYMIQAVVLNSYEVAFTCGRDGDIIPDTWVYNLADDTWTQYDDKITPVFGYTAGAFVSDDSTTTSYVVASGYYSQSGGQNYNVEIIDFKNYPEVVTAIPEDGLTDVAIDTDVAVEFNMPVTLGTGSVTIEDASGTAVTGVSVSLSGLNNSLLEISHDDFDYEETYSVTLAAETGMNGTKGNYEFTFTFTTVSDAPVITSTAPTTATEDETYTYTVTATDADGDALTYSLSNQPNGMTISDNVITWTPAEGITSSGEVTLTVSDGELSDTETFTITVTAVNDAPVITSTAPTLATEDITYTYTIEASDAEGDALTYSLSNEPDGMTISDNVITWTPIEGVTTSGEVTLTVSDGSLSDTETFTITVAAVNDAPVITSTAPGTATEDVAYTYTIEASDVEGDELTYSLSNEPDGMTISNNVITWTPAEGTTSSGEVTLTVSDGELSNTETFTIAVTSVNDAPLITSTAPGTATEDIAYTYTIEASDAEGDELTYSLSNEPDGMTISNNVITWTPVEGITTSGEVTLTVSDGELSDTETFTITVTAVNDAPVITSTAPTTAAEDDVYTYTIEATDAEGDALTYSLSNEPDGMTISDNVITWTPIEGVTTSGEVTLTVSDGSLSDTETFTITVTAVNDAPVITSTAPTSATENEVYTYTIEATDAEGDALTYSLSNEPDGMTISNNVITWTPAEGTTFSGDVTLTVSDGELSDTETFTITVTAVNDAPVITSIAPTTATEDEVYTYTVTATDADGDALTYSLSNQPDGMSISGNVITWTPAEGITTSGEVTLTVSDGELSDTETFTITVTAVNDAPVITSTAPTLATEDVTYTYTIEASDAEGDALTYNLSNEPDGMSISNNVITWTPAEGITSSGEVTLTVSDGELYDTQSFTIIISESGTNLAPEITSTAPATAVEDETYTYTVIATDANGDALTYSLSNEPDGMTISGNVITWAPGEGVTSSGEVTLTVSDGGLSDTETFTIAVTAVNDAPVITSTASTTAAEDDVYTYTIEAADAEGDALTYSLSNEPNGMVISYNVITWTPGEGITSSGEVTLTVSDGELSDTETFTITVTAVNDAPVITSTAPTLATEDVTYTYTIEASDAEGDALTYNLSNEPDGMSISNNVITWTPAEGITSSGEVTLTVSDGELYDTQSFTIIISESGTNLAPEITSTAPATAVEDETYTYTVIATDANGDALTYSLSNEPDGMTISSNVITWTPVEGVTTSGEVTLTVSDGELSDTETFTITVTAVNDAPVITSTAPVSVVVGSEYTYTIVAADADGDALTYSLSNQPDGMRVSTEGIISWVPAEGTTTSGEVTLTVSDGQLSDIETFTISVTNNSTSINQEISESLNLYPNPVANTFQISGFKGLATVYIYNLQGQLVRNQQITANVDINVSALKSGAYVVKVQTTKGVAVKSIIKE